MQTEYYKGKALSSITQGWSVSLTLSHHALGANQISGFTRGLEVQTQQLRVKQLICDSLNGMKIRQSLRQPYISQAGTQVP